MKKYFALLAATLIGTSGYSKELPETYSSEYGNWKHTYKTEHGVKVTCSNKEIQFGNKIVDESTFNKNILGCEEKRLSFINTYIKTFLGGLDEPGNALHIDNCQGYQNKNLCNKLGAGERDHIFTLQVGGNLSPSETLHVTTDEHYKLTGFVAYENNEPVNNKFAYFFTPTINIRHLDPELSKSFKEIEQELGKKVNKVEETPTSAFVRSALEKSLRPYIKK